jgi:hypothetical protein
MLHNTSFPAGYKENNTPRGKDLILKNLAMDLWITGAEPWISARIVEMPALIHSSARKPVTHKLHSLYCDDRSASKRQ